MHPNAAVISQYDVGTEDKLMDRVGSTGKGVGAAIAAKVWRSPMAVFKYYKVNVDGIELAPDNYAPWRDGQVFVEVSQGWSLGINQRFYPYTTSRECSVAQAISDLGAPPSSVRRSIVSLRTFPIRVASPHRGY